MNLYITKSQVQQVIFFSNVQCTMYNKMHGTEHSDIMNPDITKSPL